MKKREKLTSNKSKIISSILIPPIINTKTPFLLRHKNNIFPIGTFSKTNKNSCQIYKLQNVVNNDKIKRHQEFDTNKNELNKSFNKFGGNKKRKVNKNDLLKNRKYDLNERKLVSKINKNEIKHRRLFTWVQTEKHIKSNKVKNNKSKNCGFNTEILKNKFKNKIKLFKKSFFNFYTKKEKTTQGTSTNGEIREEENNNRKYKTYVDYFNDFQTSKDNNMQSKNIYLISANKKFSDNKYYKNLIKLKLEQQEKTAYDKIEELDIEKMKFFNKKLTVIDISLSKNNDERDSNVKQALIKSGDKPLLINAGINK